MAQKPEIDHSMIKQYPRIVTTEISNDGKYLIYSVTNGASGVQMYIQSVDKTILKQIPAKVDFGSPSFTEDSRHVIFFKSMDSLCIMNLANKEEQDVPNCVSYKVATEGFGKWLAYQLKDNMVVLNNLENGTSKTFLNVKDYQFSPHGKIFLIQTEAKPETDVIRTLTRIRLKDDQRRIIWHGTRVTNLTFDQSDYNIAFIAKDGYSDTAENEVCYYNDSIGTVKTIVKRDKLSLGKEFQVSDRVITFSSSGWKIFFQINTPKERAKT